MYNKRFGGKESESSVKSVCLEKKIVIHMNRIIDNDDDDDYCDGYLLEDMSLLPLRRELQTCLNGLHLVAYFLLV